MDADVTNLCDADNISFVVCFFRIVSDDSIRRNRSLGPVVIFRIMKENNINQYNSSILFCVGGWSSVM